MIPAMERFFTTPNLLTTLFNMGDFSPEDLARCSSVNKIFYLVISTKMNDYWHRQYDMLGYPKIFLDKTTLLKKYLINIATTVWKNEFDTQKNRELVEKRAYRIINEYNKKENHWIDNNKLTESEKELVADFRAYYQDDDEEDDDGTIFQPITTYTEAIVSGKWKNSLIKIDIKKCAIILDPLPISHKEQFEILKKYHLDSMFYKHNCDFEVEMAQKFLDDYEPNNIGPCCTIGL